MDDDWVSRGVADETAREGPSAPAYIEVSPDNFKPLGQCTVAEIRSAGEAKLVQARALMDESGILLQIAEQREKD